MHIQVYIKLGTVIISVKMLLMAGVGILHFVKLGDNLAELVPKKDRLAGLLELFVRPCHIL